MKISDTGKNANNSHVLILGGGYAGLLTAIRLAGKTKRNPMSITLVNNSHSFVERIRLHQLASNQPLRTISIPQILKGTGVQFVQGWASQIDPTEQVVKVQQPDGEVLLPYESLVYAVGSCVDIESTHGVAQNATALGSHAMGIQIRESVPQIAQKSGSVLVVGAGLTGIEVATELAETYPALQVTVATRGKLGDDLSTTGQEHLRQTFKRMGIQVEESFEVAQANEGCVVDSTGKRLPFDLCIWSAGFSVPQLAADANIACDHKGRIRVDERLRSINYPNIYAIGDSASTPLRMACATAMPMGGYFADQLAAIAKNGLDAASQSLEPFRFAYALRCISLGRKDALIQMVEKDDTPKERIFTGNRGALIKELICRFTIWALQFEKLFPGSYKWLKAPLSMTKEPVSKVHLEPEISSQKAVSI